MTTAVVEEPIDVDGARRELVQRAASRSYRAKVRNSRIFLSALLGCLLFAFIPLGDIIYNVLRRGLPYISWSFLTGDQKLASNTHQSAFGGIGNGITGTFEIFGFALAIAIPLGICVGIALYESRGRAMGAFRIILEVMVGMPSILFGVFIFSFVVRRMSYQPTQIAGSLALAVLMIPLISVSCELALRSVPDIYVEAALALGAKRSTTMRRVILPHALPRVWTGIMLSGARAVGETAPILFVIGTNFGHDWNPLSEASALPTMMYNNLGSYYQPVINEDWGIALVLITAVLVLNLISRFIVARASKGRT
jgi:phosphate transport system permease protein